MDQFSKILSELLQLNWRNAVALFAAGVCTLGLRKLGYLDDTSEFFIAFCATFGFWILVTLGVDQIRKSTIARERLRRSASARMAAAAANKAAADEAAAAAQLRSIGNLKHLHQWEEDALYWIYQQVDFRARASIHHKGIDGLLTMGLIHREESKGTWTDTTWKIPDHIVTELHKLYGEPNPNHRPRPAPWER